MITEEQREELMGLKPKVDLYETVDKANTRPLLTVYENESYRLEIRTVYLNPLPCPDWAAIESVTENLIIK